MARMKIELPDHWEYETEIAVRITDLNYGNHLANQNLLSYAHEARVHYFKAFDLSEMDFAGVQLIQSDAAVIFKHEAYFADKLRVKMTAVSEGRSAFNIYYEVVNQDNKIVAHMRTAIVCYNYEQARVVAIPEEVYSRGFLKS